MAVITSRQPGLRPETIRTRLARFMPSRAATGWSAAWSAGSDHAEEIADELELRTVEHLACYGTVVSHALAQAELAPRRLRITADCTTGDDDTPVITIEVRAQISGPALDQALFDAIIHRAEPTCPVLKGLASDATVRLIAILDDTLMSQPVAGPTQTTASATTPSSAASKSQAEAAHTPTNPEAPKDTAASAHSPAANQARTSASRLSNTAMAMLRAVRLPHMSRTAPDQRLNTPRWLTTRMAVLLAVAFGTVASLPLMWSPPA
jgi:hypothetical protein